MTENIPPVPPAPQPQSYPPHAPSGVIPGNEPSYGPPQPYAPSAPPAYGQQQFQQPQYAPYPPQRYAPVGYQGQLKPKSSGYRVASGIIGIVLGVFLLLPSIAGFSTGSAIFMAFLILVAALGNITAGILLLANQRGRSQGSPITSLVLAGFSLLLGFVGIFVTYYSGTLLVFTLLLATPILIVMGIGLSREKRAARDS